MISRIPAGKAPLADFLDEELFSFVECEHKPGKAIEVSSSILPDELEYLQAVFSYIDAQTLEEFVVKVYQILSL